MARNEDAPKVTNAKLELDGKQEVRSGVYANIALARTTPKETVLDFAFIDANEQEGDFIVTHGKFQARIIMSNASLIELRDMLNKHIAQNIQNFPMGESAN